MITIYETKIVKVGDLAYRFLEDNIILLFSEKSVMKEIKRYSLLVKPVKLTDKIEKGDYIVIGNQKSEIVKVGSIVNKNLSEISHITIRFEEPSDEIFPGTLYCKPVKNLSISNMDSIKILKKENV